MASTSTEAGKIGLIEWTSEADANIRAAERYGLENGREGIPRTDLNGLDSTERRLMAFYEGLVGTRTKAYFQNLDEQDQLIDERFLEESSGQHDENPDYSVWTERAEAAMWQVVENGAHELEDLQRRAQDAQNDLTSFTAKNGLTREPKITKDWMTSLIWIAIFLIVETAINAVAFLGLDNVPGGAMGAGGEAFGISLINVGALGCAAGLLFRGTRARNLYMCSAAWFGLIGVLLLAIVWNVAAGHYRDTLEGAAIPPECLESLEDPANPTKAEINAIAICRLRNEGTSMAGFQAYLLFLMGLAFFGLATWKWWQIDDPYPGYGDIGREWTRNRDALDEKRATMLAELDQKLVVGRDKVQGVFKDPVEQWHASVAALRERERLYRDHLESIGWSEMELKEVISMYRSANQQARPADSLPPPHWDTQFEHSLDVPAPPRELQIRPVDHALELRKSELQILQLCYSKLNATHDACACRVLTLSYISTGTEIEEISELNHDATQAQIVKAVSHMGDRDGKLGIPHSNHAGTGVSESRIRLFYLDLHERNARRYEEGLKAQLDVMDRRVLAGQVNGTENYSQPEPAQLVACSAMRGIVRESQVRLDDLRRQTQDAADTFQKAKAVREFASVNKAAGAEIAKPTSPSVSDFRQAKSDFEKARAAMAGSRDKVLERVSEIHKNACTELDATYKNPVKEWSRTDTAIGECKTLHASYITEAQQLNRKYQETIEIYRTANRQSRRDGLPAPAQWSPGVDPVIEEFKPPPNLELCAMDEAQRLQQDYARQMSVERDALDACLEDCYSRVSQLTELING
ncbi:MAG: hypothetical protein OXI38_06195 [Bacteroidota bacterium]|nr:hypothetical protein [Bacteroidota bacterium]